MKLPTEIIKWTDGLNVRLALLALFSVTFLGACSELERPKVEPFYAESAPPPKQELRWSNGQMPKTLDPARSIAAPEADIVRAIYEGLTDLDSTTLREVPGVAEKWEHSADFRTWTFHLRKDARWSNGERVTAADFVRSWKRVAVVGEKTGHAYLYQNIAGLRAPAKSNEPATGISTDFLPAPDGDMYSRNGALRLDGTRLQTDQETRPNAPAATTPPDERGSQTGTVKPTPAEKLGVEAVDEQTLRVRLEIADKDFARLVSNPVFRPVYGSGSDLEQPPLKKDVITNGPFRIAEITDSGLLLERSEKYWNADAVTLERVRFVTAASSEAALQAYRKGEVDVVTNAEFAPAALKILAPYEDFRSTPHSALNYYEFNTALHPFSDRRVREALAIAIDREKVTEGELEGATKPANAFLPLGNIQVDQLSLDVERALSLLAQAGYPEGRNFPTIRLVVNRNDTQQRVARSVARMWKQNLNLETEIIVKEWSEIDAVKTAGEFDLIRRGVVLPTVDELVSLTAIFGSPADKMGDEGIETGIAKPVANPTFDFLTDLAPVVQERSPGSLPSNGDTAAKTLVLEPVAEENAMYDLHAIPLYFPMSYSLVKPYVKGFDMNGLDAPSLREMSIDAAWQPKQNRN